MAHLLADAADIVRCRLPHARALDVRAADDGLRDLQCSAAPFPPRHRGHRLLWRRAVPDRRCAVRIDDGAGAEDLLLPRAVGHDDVRRRVRGRCAASAAYLFTGKTSADRIAAAAAELTVLFGAIVLMTGPALGAEGLGRLVAVGCAPHLVAAALDDVRGVSAGAEIRRARVREAGGRRSAVRHGQRAVRLRLCERLAHGAPQDDGRAVAWCRACAGRSGSAWPRSCCCSSCCWPCGVRLAEQQAELESLYRDLDEGSVGV